MKKTKLLTSIAALALVLGLGACTTTEDETPSDSGTDTTTDEETETTTDTNTPTEGGEVSTEGAYALVGDFVDSDWNESPDTSSKYFIPAETETYEVTVEIASEPVDNEWWSEDNQWSAGLRVVDYGTWNLAIGYSNLDSSSTGVSQGSDSDNIAVSWNATYTITLTFGETPSILVTQVTE